MSRIVPFLGWAKGFTAHTLRADVISGVTVALVLIPQSMAYAQLAGLPPYYGLYAAFLPPMVAALFGSSRQLATLEPLATAGSTEYVQYAILLALLVGIFQFALGVLRLGLIVNFISHPVVNGFTNAAALIIATSQLSKLFRVHVDKADHHYETVYRVIAAAVEHTHWPSLGMAALAFAIMYGLRKLDRRIPNVLAAVVVAIVLAWATGFDDNVNVELSQIQSSSARSAIVEYNARAAEKSDFELLRSIGASGLAQARDLPALVERSCTNCHAIRKSGPKRLRELDFNTQTELNTRTLLRTEGLLDRHFALVRDDMASDRARLRHMSFEAGRDEAGGRRV